MEIPQAKLETAFETHIAKELPFLKEEKLLIACSGGIDSMVLTHLCQSIKLDIALAHCNFKLRNKESDGDETFVKAYAKQYQIPYHSITFDTEKYAQEEQLSIQMAARALRYNWFEQLAIQNNYMYVFTAHHADDNLETFLINLSRGTGIEGLTGIPQVNKKYIRPLLPFSRVDIEQFALEKEIHWREDSSNSVTKYVRNKLRHNVIPEFKTINQNTLQNFNKTIQHLQQYAAFTEKQLARIKAEIFKKAEEKSNVYTISLKALKEYDISEGDLYFVFKDYGFTSWIEIENLIKAQSGKQIFSASHRLLKDRAVLLLMPLSNESKKEKALEIELNKKEVSLERGLLKIEEVEEIDVKNKNTIYIDKDKLKSSLSVRKWNNGDYFYPLGMQGKKKLSKFFKDEKLSLIAKENVQLLCDKDQIIWVIGHRADNRYKITTQTKHILRIIWIE